MTGTLIIGAGQAALSLAAKLRSSGYDEPITMFGDEAVPPYQRPPLSKGYLLGDMELERLFLRPPDFYADNDIDLRLNETVTGLDPASMSVTTAGGETVSASDIVLATGSEPIALPAAIGGDLDGLYLVRRLADIDAMAHEFAPGRKALIVGGGYIGLEAAAVAAKKGLDVTLVEMADRILQRVASPETSDYFRALHEAHGVTLLEGTGLDGLKGHDGRVVQAHLTDGSLRDVDFVIVGIGIRPATRLAEAGGLTIDNGIWTDEMGRTSAPGIWAAGDCTSFPYQGRRIRLESVPNAIDQAEAVAANIMGAEAPYAAQPWFWSDQYDITLQIGGLNTGYDNTVVRPGDREGTQSVWYYKGDTLLAVDAMSDARAYMVGKRLIEAGKSPDKAAISDPETNLKALLKG